ncbi:MAG: 2-oxoacid:acceptor oxidoreductase subunit alpha [Phycisphaerae bacterium]
MTTTSTSVQSTEHHKKTVELNEAAVRMAGDSGDGMQLIGTQLTNTSAIFGNDISTFPDFPAEIRAPAGTLAGVSGFQIHFSSKDIRTPGDKVDALIAMNPAALKVNIADVEVGGIVIVNEDAFTKTNLKKAGYDANPLDDGALNRFRVYRVPLSKFTAEALKDCGMSTKAVERCKNFFALGLVYWMYGRPMDTTLKWIGDKFAKNPTVADANTKALKSGYYFGETAEIFSERYTVAKARIAPGRYRKVTGNEAVAIGLVAAARVANKTLFYGTYPITPASDILHQLSRYKHYDVRTFQAEDEIAAITSTIGASYAGAIGVTASSGPGIALKGEALGLAVMMELPLVIINVQRGGPSTGLPTKTEQSDLYQAVFGRNGDTFLPVLAASTPSDCFILAYEAVRLATRYMTPVMLLTDGYLGNGAEPWRIPDINRLPKIEIKHPTEPNDPAGFMPFKRDERLARPWAIPGTPGLEHRVGGLEKQDGSGDVCYDADNHHHMTMTRLAKVRGIAAELPPLKVEGPSSGDLLVIGWGGTYGAISMAVKHLQEQGKSVSHCHLRYMFPYQKELGAILKSFRRVLAPELNTGQLRQMLRAEFLVDVVGMNKIKGKPFFIKELEVEMLAQLNGTQTA